MSAANATFRLISIATTAMSTMAQLVGVNGPASCTGSRADECALSAAGDAAYSRARDMIRSSTMPPETKLSE